MDFWISEATQEVVPGEARSRFISKDHMLQLDNLGCASNTELYEFMDCYRERWIRSVLYSIKGDHEIQDRLQSKVEETVEEVLMGLSIPSEDGLKA